MSEKTSADDEDRQAADVVHAKDEHVVADATFPLRLRQTRQRRLLDQTELGAEAQIPATSISLFESGKRKPSFDNLTRLADVLNVSVDYLLGRSDDPDAHLGSPAHMGRQAEVQKQLEHIENLLRETRVWFGKRKASAP